MSFPALLGSYAPNPSTTQWFWRKALGVLNVMAAVAPVLALIQQQNSNPASIVETLWDSLGHAARAALLLGAQQGLGATATTIDDFARLIFLLRDCSTFPTEIANLDSILHLLNTLSPAIL